jgi:hypothetical protein
VVEVARQLLVDRVVRKHGFELARNEQHLLHQAARYALVQPMVGLPQLHGQNEQRGQLAGEGFGGGHADFGPRVGINGARRFPRDHGADHVADGQRLRAPMLGLALCRQRIRGLAGLRDHHRERIFQNDRVAIAELAAVIHLNRNARQFLDEELARQRRVPTGAAGNDAHRPETREFGRRDIHLIQKNASRFLAHTPQHGVANRPRLLVNLLEHEVLVAALFRQNRVPQHVRHLPVHGPALKVAQTHAVGLQNRHVAIRQEEHVAGIAENRRHVGRDEVFVVADAYHHRRTVPRRYDLIGIRARDHGQRKHPGQFLHRCADSLFQVAREVFLHQVRDDFGVSLGPELVAFGFELVFEREIVFDDPVVHHHHVALAVAMRVGVLFGGPAMGGPARMADPERAVYRVHADGVFQVAQLPLGPAYRQLALFVVYRQPRRIVPAVLQPAQPIQNDWHRFACANVAYNSTHSYIIGTRSLFCVLGGTGVSPVFRPGTPRLPD